MLFLDVVKLYKTSLRIGLNRPWAMVHGEYLALRLRNEFVDAHFRGIPDEDTGYYQFIEDYTKRGFTPPYDGNKHYAIANAKEVCVRYHDLIESMRSSLPLYNTMNFWNAKKILRELHGDLHERRPRTVYYFKDRTYGFQKESSPYPTVVRIGINFVIGNGTHRLAAFKYFYDKGAAIKRFPALWV